jgi:C1A family cysteine protease
MNLALPIRGYGAVKKDDEQALKEAVFKYGPVAITMTCTDRKFMFYKSGVFDGLDGKGMLHAMLVVGYGTETDHYGRKKDYWIVKNSYGLQWGEKGYIRLLRNKGNKCSIASDAFYPII